MNEIVVGLSTLLMIYSGTLTTPETTITVGSWGAGRCAQVTDVGYQKAGALAVRVLDPYQGARLDFAKPLDFTAYFTDSKETYLELWVLPTYATEGQPGAGTYLPGGVARPADGAYELGPVVVTQFRALRTLRVVLTGPKGMVSAEPCDLVPGTLGDRGWRRIDVPINKFLPKPKDGFQVERMVIAGGPAEEFYIGQIAIVRDTTPIQVRIVPHDTHVRAGQQTALAVEVEGGAAQTQVSWDFDSSRRIGGLVLAQRAGHLYHHLHSNRRGRQQGQRRRHHEHQGHPMTPLAAREPAAARWLRRLAGLARTWDFETKTGAELGYQALDQIWMRDGRPRILFQTAPGPVPAQRIILALAARDCTPELELILVTAPGATLEGAALADALASGSYGYWESIDGEALDEFADSGRVPEPGLPPRWLTRGEVVLSAPACLGHHKLVVRCPAIARAARPGQFLHIACATEAELAAFAESKNRALDRGRDGRAGAQPPGSGQWPLLRRPMSVHGLGSDAAPPPPGRSLLPRALRRLVEYACRTQVSLLLKTVGVGARRLAERGVGEWLDLLGPLGTPVPIADDLERAIVVAGGIGIAPLALLAEECARLGIETHLLVGARDRDHLPIGLEADDWARPLVTEFEARGIAVDVVTEAEDGLTVTERFERRRDELLTGGRVEVFACGPRAMLERLYRDVGDQVPMRVLLEERMACGVGACRSCVTRVRSDRPPGYAFATVCRDGPSFPASEVIWG
jgi:dihydroorotate dehydrogenase electron transfer subunit